MSKEISIFGVNLLVDEDKFQNLRDKLVENNINFETLDDVTIVCIFLSFLFLLNFFRIFIP